MWPMQCERQDPALSALATRAPSRFLGEASQHSGVRGALVTEKIRTHEETGLRGDAEFELVSPPLRFCEVKTVVPPRALLLRVGLARVAAALAPPRNLPGRRRGPAEPHVNGAPDALSLPWLQTTDRPTPAAPEAGTPGGAGPCCRCGDGKVAAGKTDL